MSGTRLRYLAVTYLALALLLVGAAAPALAQEYPQAVGYVNDFAGVFAPDVRASLEESLRQFEEETTVELAVVTVPDLGGDTIEGYAVGLFEDWAIGKKDVDNGILLILALEERDIRIEVGYGMEPYLTDGQAGRILDESVLPDLRENNYALGLLKGAQAIAQTIHDSDYVPGTVRERSALEGPELPPALTWGMIGVGAVSIYLFGYLARSRSIWPGAAWGVVVGGFFGWLFGGLIAISIGAAIAGVAGFFLDAVLSAAYRAQAASGGSTGFRRTRGGFFGGGHWGGWGGGGLGGGGFGGFGGGRSGGGGASRGF